MATSPSTITTTHTQSFTFTNLWAPLHRVGTRNVHQCRVTRHEVDSDEPSRRLVATGDFVAGRRSRGDFVAGLPATPPDDLAVRVFRPCLSEDPDTVTASNSVRARRPCRGVRQGFR